MYSNHKVAFNIDVRNALIQLQNYGAHSLPRLHAHFHVLLCDIGIAFCDMHGLIGYLLFHYAI